MILRPLPMRPVPLPAIIRSMLVAWLLVLAAACGARSDPEQALREQLAGLEQALDQRDVAGIHARLADDFAGPDGMGREDARRLAAGMFVRYRNTRVQVTPPTITLQGNGRATVELKAALVGGSGALLPESGQVYAVTTGWRMDDGEWRMVQAHWQPAL